MRGSWIWKRGAITVALLVLVFVFILGAGAASAAEADLQIFYLPLPEDQVWTALDVTGNGTPDSTMVSVTGISITGNGTFIYYDHWEGTGGDAGYEADLSAPTQPSSRIWGDGNAGNGCAPNINGVAVVCTNANDVLNAGDVILLVNNVPLPRNAANFFYDGRDKVGASDVVAITRSVWATTPGTLLASTVEAYDITRWGTEFRIPIGEDVITSGTNIYEYTSVLVMARQANTTVNIDLNGTGGAPDITQVLNQGGVYQVPQASALLGNARVYSDKPIQVVAVGGEVSSTYMARWYSIPPNTQWDSSYYTPVGTTQANNEAYVFLYNPNQTTAITVNYQTTGGTGTINVPARDTVSFQMPLNSGARFWTTNGSQFLAVGAMDANPNENGTSYDWGYTLVPEAWLTTEFVAGWAPGTGACISGGSCPTNGSPVWVTAAAPTTIYVKYDGDITTGPNTAPNGYKYDVSYTLTAFQSKLIFDPDGNQTGMRVFTTDGTVIVGAWGEDPVAADQGSPYLDMGYTIPPLPIPKITKAATIVDANGNSQLDPGEYIDYTIVVSNKSPFPLPSAQLVDTLPANTSYVLNSTTVNGSPIADNGIGTPFPLDAPGINLGSIAVNGSIPVTFRVQTNTTGSYTSVTNTASVTARGMTRDATVTLPVVQTPRLTLVKVGTLDMTVVAPSDKANVGDKINYTLTATNAGNVTLTNVTVSDTKAAPLTCTPASGSSLAPGGSMVCTGSYTLTQADINAGQVVNTAAADSAETPIVTDTKTVTIPQSPALTLDKAASPASYDAVGDVISYSYLLTNSGNVALTAPYSVTDNKATVLCNQTPSPLPPGGTVTCTATYSITQADLNAGSVTNTATATALFGTAPVNSNQDQATVTADQTPRLTLDKTASPASYDAVGDVISYSYLLTNSGNVSLTPPYAVTDNKATVLCNQTPSPLPPGGTVTCSASYTITQADLEAGSVTNTATATARHNGNPITSNTDTATVTADQTPRLTLDKTASPASYDSVSDVISYSYLLTNSGNVSLTAPYAVTDNKATVLCNQTPSPLPPGGTVTCSASYTITQADLEAGSVTNTATATARHNGNPITSNTDTATVTADQNPALSVLKQVSTSASGPWAASVTLSAPGTVYYQFTVRNTGNVTLSVPFAVQDAVLTGRGVTINCSAAPPTLDPGGTFICTASYAVTQADINAGGLQNTATASATFDNQPVTSSPSTANVLVTQSPLLELTKDVSTSASGPWAASVTLSAPGTVYYQFTLRNTGNVTLSAPFAVQDAVLTGRGVTITCPSGTLAPNATLVCTASTTVSQADIDAGGFTNTATATARFGAQTVTSNQDQAVVNVNQQPALTLDKTASPTSYDAVGDVISYSYLLTNAGNVSLTPTYSVTDNKATVTCPATPNPLPPGGTVTCTATYSITQADLDAGSVTNTATGQAYFGQTPVPSNQDSETVNATQTPRLTLDKTASPASYDAVGDVISYSYLLTNAGNVSLTPPYAVSDNKATVTCNQTPSPLLPGGTVTCTATYSITQADLNAGSVTNTATATASYNGNPITSNTDTATATADQTPRLTLDKTASPTSYDAVGDVISYSYLLTNSGNVSLTPPYAVSDNKATVTCPATPNPLLPGGTVTCTATYSITQPDLDAGSVTNTATGQAYFGTAPVNSNQDQETVTADQTPRLTLDKTASPASYDAVGDVISYSYLLTNSGNVSLTPTYSVTDNKATVLCNQTPNPLPPGGTVTCTATYSITQADLDAGSVTNTATGQAYFGQSPLNSNQDQATVTANQNPALSVLKQVSTSASGPWAASVTLSAPGTVYYQFTVRNTGNVTLSVPFAVQDAVLTGRGVTINCSAAPPTLDPGGTFICTASYAVTQADINAGGLQNTATASATFDNQPVTSSPSTANVLVTQTPLLELTKDVSASASGPWAASVTLSAPGTVYYQFTLRNTGNVTLSAPFAVQDAVLTGRGVTITCPSGTLAPNATLVCTASTTVSQADIDAGGFTNTATASATFDNTPVGSNQDQAVVNVNQQPALTLTKTGTLDMTVVAPGDRADVGDKVNYTLTATNSGNVTLHVVTISDPKLGTLACIPAQPATLAPTQSLVCTGTYTLTQADINDGQVVNTATADSAETPIVTDSITVPIPRVPLLTLVKRGALDMTVVAPADRADVGDKVNYTLTATNAGNVTLTSVTIVDAKLGTLTCTPTQPTTLQPGQSLVCTGSYTLTQADINVGEVDNTATADSEQTPPTETPVTVPVPQAPLLRLDKVGTVDMTVVDPDNLPDIGDKVNYTLTATNLGNVTLTNVTIVDPKLGTLTCTPAQPTTLQPGQSLVCTGTYTLVRTDLLAGYAANTAVADSDQTPPTRDTVTVNLVQCDPDPVTGASYYQLPVLGYVGNSTTNVEYVIEAQNVGATWTKIALLLFAEAQPYCEPQVNAPFKLECSGLLKPGSSWIWSSNALSRSAKSAIAFSFDPTLVDCYDINANLSKRWPKQWTSYTNGGQVVGGFPFNWNPYHGQPIAVEVVRRAPAPANSALVVSSAYSGVSARQDGRYDPAFGGYAFYAPVVYSGFLGMNSTLYLQNSGDECTSLELWFKAQDDCLRAMVCEVMALAPGYTAQVNATTCVPPGFIGSVWIRATQPLGIVVDQLGSNTLMSYTGAPASLNYGVYSDYLGGGSQVAYGPLMYREYNGWDTRVYVQNMSGVVAAKVKVYFVDHKGGIITTLVDWVCPRGEQTFYLPLVNNLPGQYVGAIRVESQAWETPGEFLVEAPPIAAVAELVQYSSAARQTPLQAVAYNLLRQEDGYIWQVGAGFGGLQSGTAVIAIPSLLQKGNTLGIQTELAIQNLVPKPGFTDFALFVYDQNGLLDYVCEKLNEKQVEYIDLATWGWIAPGFKGSAVISATFWEHDVFDGSGQLQRNVVGLGAIKVERYVPTAGVGQPAGDVAAASEGFPIPGKLGRCPNFHWEGFPPICPGQPGWQP